eukprot:scpid2472/ scgid21075/ Neural cell adhesion molecule 1
MAAERLLLVWLMGSWCLCRGVYANAVERPRQEPIGHGGARASNRIPPNHEEPPAGRGNQQQLLASRTDTASDVSGVTVSATTTEPSAGDRMMDRAPDRAGERSGQQAHAFPPACAPRPHSPPAAYTVQAAKAGRRITLRCSLGVRQDAVQWYIGGERLEDRFSNKVLRPIGGRRGPIAYGEFDLLRNGNLRVRRLTSGHEGLYHCTPKTPSRSGRLSNASECRTILLRLQAPPRPLREMYRRRVLVSGKTSIVACKIRGYPKPQIRWARDGAVIDGGNPRYSYLSDGSLVIRHTSQVDAGHFVCMAENPLGKRNISVQVSIVGQPNMESPIIIKAPRNRKARPGGSVTLTCSAVGSNLLEINWEFLGQNLSSQPLRLRHRQLQNPHDGNGLLTVVSELVISSVSINDVGRYRCIASNLSGWTSASGELALNTQR